MAQPTRSGPSPILPAVAGALAAVVLVGGAWLVLQGGDDSVEVTTDTTSATTPPDSSNTTVGDGDEPGDTTTSVRPTEDTTDGTTIDDVPLSDLPSGAPGTFVGVTSDTFELVRVDADSGEIVERLGGWGGEGDELLQALQFVELAPDGTIYVDDCCEPAYGSTFIVDSSFEPGITPSLSGLSPELSPDGSRLARNDLGSAITISDADGNPLGTFGEPDFTGAVLRPLTWIDSSTLAVVSEDAGAQTLQILDVATPGTPVVGASRLDPDRTYLSADVRADGNILVVTRIEDGSDAGDVIAEVIDVSTGDVLVDFNLPDDVYAANYDASGLFVVVARSNGQLDWYGGGQRGTLATGFISADW